MKQLYSWKAAAVCIFVIAILAVGQKDVFCYFSVDWDVSSDDGRLGDRHIAQWLVDNGYYTNEHDARGFARTGYIGYDSGDADPFYWDIAMPFSVEIVQEIAGYADYNILGYYIGSGNTKSFTQTFSGSENGPKTLMINEPFGLYLGPPEQNLWYTDRAENEGRQDGILKRPGGNAQALIYELNPAHEWLVAWEDLDATGLCSDRDYNDMYVRLTVIPEPISGVLFLFGGGVLTAVGIRKRRGKRIL